MAYRKEIRTHQKWLIALFLALVLLTGSLYRTVGDAWSPAQRALTQTDAVTQELYKTSPFDILDQASEARINLDGCSTYQTTLRIGSPLSLSESVPAPGNAIQKSGRTLLSDNYAPIIFYYHRAAGEVLAIYTENIGPREWLQPPATGTYSSFLYVVISSGFNYVGPCKHF